MGAEAEIGTRIDFDPIPGKKVTDEVAVVSAIAWHNWNQPYGKVVLTYGRNGLSTGFEFNTRNAESLGFATYNGDNYTFEAKVDIGNVVGLAVANTANEGTTPVYPLKRLWGRYDFLNGVVPVVVAINSYDNGDGDWTSDKRAVFKDPRAQFYQTNNLFGVEDSFAKFDHPDLIMAKVKLDSIDFGVQVRNLFPWVANRWGGLGGGGRYASYGYGRIPDADPMVIPDYNPNPTNANHFNKLVDDVLKKSIIGLKFTMAPLEFAAQFKLEQYGVYFGGKFVTGPVSLGLSFAGELGKENASGAETPLRMQFGGGVDYNAGAFGGGVNAYYKRNEATLAGVPQRGKYSSLIAVQPNFFFNAIPSHLRFRVDTAFYFTSDYFASDDTTEKDVIWALEPQIYWNFKGTGAGGYPWGGTGVLVRYRMVSYDKVGYERLGYNAAGTNGGSANFLDLVFKWGL